MSGPIDRHRHAIAFALRLPSFDRTAAGFVIDIVTGHETGTFQLALNDELAGRHLADVDRDRLADAILRRLHPGEITLALIDIHRAETTGDGAA